MFQTYSRTKHANKKKKKKIKKKLQYFFDMAELQSPVQEERRGKIANSGWNEWGVNFILTGWAGLNCQWKLWMYFFDSMLL